MAISKNRLKFLYYELHLKSYLIDPLFIIASFLCLISFVFFIIHVLLNLTLKYMDLFTFIGLLICFAFMSCIFFFCVCIVLFKLRSDRLKELNRILSESKSNLGSFKQTGAALNYGIIAVWTVFPAIVSFGWLIPWRSHKLYGYQVEHTKIQNIAYDFDGDAEVAIRKFLHLFIGISLLAGGVWIFFAFAFLGLAVAVIDAPGSESLESFYWFIVYIVYGSLVLLPIGLLYIFISFFFYLSNLINYLAISTKAENVRFKLKTKAWPLFLFFVGGYLSILVSLGIAYKAVERSYRAYLLKNLQLVPADKAVSTSNNTNV